MTVPSSDLASTQDFLVFVFFHFLHCCEYKLQSKDIGNKASSFSVSFCKYCIHYSECLPQYTSIVLGKTLVITIQLMLVSQF